MIIDSSATVFERTHHALRHAKESLRRSEVALQRGKKPQYLIKVKVPLSSNKKSLASARDFYMYSGGGSRTHDLSGMNRML